MSVFKHEKSIDMLRLTHGECAVKHSLMHNLQPREIAAMCEMSLEYALRIGEYLPGSYDTLEIRRDGDVFLASHPWLVELLINKFGCWTDVRSASVVGQLILLRGFEIPEDIKEWTVGQLSSGTRKRLPPRVGIPKPIDGFMIQDMLSVTYINWSKVI